MDTLKGKTPPACFVALPAELQTQIIQNLASDKHTLSFATRVNKMWHSLCMGMLWQYTEARHLAAIDHISRRQYYANTIQTLWIPYVIDGCKFEHLTFPSLKRLVLHGRTCHERWDTKKADLLSACFRLRPYLQSSLETLRFIHFPLMANNLDLVQVCVPHLQSLEFENTVDHISPEMFAQFLDSFRFLKQLVFEQIHDEDFLRDVMALLADSLAPRLERLILIVLPYSPQPLTTCHKFLAKCSALQKCHFGTPWVHDGDHPLDTETAALLFTSKTLKDLRLSMEFEHDFVEEILQRTGATQILPVIRTLALRGSSSALCALLSGVNHNNLAEVTLSIVDKPQSLSELFSHCPQLVVLRLNLQRDTEIAKADFNAISMLRRLQRLEIFNRNSIEVYEPDSGSKITDFDDDDFALWISKFDRLRELQLDFRSQQLSVAAVRSLGSGCPLLEKCVLFWHHDLESWKTLGTNLFTSLEYLVLGEFTSRAGNGARAGVEERTTLLKRLAPNFKRLSVGKSFEYHELERFVDRFWSE